MVPPPPKKGLLPDKYRPSVIARGPPGPLNRNVRERQPLRATEVVMTKGPLPPSGLQDAATSLNDGSSPDEEQLSTAYTVYLQSFLLNKLTKDMQEFYTRSEAAQCVGTGFEFVSTATKSVMTNAPLSLLVMKIEHLVQTKEFVKIYSELAEMFGSEKSATLAELQRALEARFNGIPLKELDNSSRAGESEEEVDLDDLIERVRDNLAPTCPKGKPTNVKSFLFMFVDALKELLSSASEAEKMSQASNELTETLMDLNSMMISYSAISENEPHPNA